RERGEGSDHRRGGETQKAVHANLPKLAATAIGRRNTEHRPDKNFKLETIGPQWSSCSSLRMAEQKCRCGPGFFAPQNADDSPARTTAAAARRWARHDARYRYHPRHRRHRY